MGSLKVYKFGIWRKKQIKLLHCCGEVGVGGGGWGGVIPIIKKPRITISRLSSLKI
jgi:hypothetical protein